MRSAVPLASPGAMALPASAGVPFALSAPYVGTRRAVSPHRAVSPIGSAGAPACGEIAGKSSQATAPALPPDLKNIHDRQRFRLGGTVNPALEGGRIFTSGVGLFIACGCRAKHEAGLAVFGRELLMNTAKPPTAGLDRATRR